MDLGLFFFIMYVLAFGMGAGWIAQLILEPHRRRSWGEALAVGVLGALLVGLVSSLVFHGVVGFTLGTILGAPLGAIVVLWIWQAIRGKRPFEHEHHEGASHPGSGSHHDTRHPHKPGRKDKKARRQ